jgi:hypothetical protein
VAEAREQEAALAVVAHGKRDVGSVENRHVLEPHDDVAADSLLGLGVDVERRGLQHPVFVAHGAGGIANVGQIHLAFRQHVDRLREAAPIAVQDLEIRLVEIRRAVDVVAAGCTAHAQFRILEIHAALDGHAAGLGVVGDRVRGDAARILLHPHAAVQDGVAIGVEFGVVAVDVYPVIVRSDAGVDRRVVLRRRRAHVAGAGHRGDRKATDNEYGSNINSHGQNASP